MAIPPNTRDHVGRYKYISDDGREFLKELTISVAAAGGFDPYDPGSGSGAIPRSMKPRHIDIKGRDTLKYHRIPVADDTYTLYADGGEISYGGETCDVISRIGESGKIGRRIPPP